MFGTDRINPATSDREKLSPETIEANKLKFIEELKPREDDKDKIDQAKDELKNLRALAMQFPLPLEKIQDELKSLIKAWMELDGRKPSKLSRLATEVANRAMPLRGKIWVWNNSDPKEPQLEQESKKDHQPETPGQRGLSIDRLEQIDRLRRCFMSIRDLGEREFAEPVNPGKGRDKPECCNELLKRLDRMKRQRVFQTAHLILQEALAQRLTSSEEIVRDHAIDQHGIYRPIEKAKPVEIIFVEDLSRYKTSTDRTRRENSRLMKWCHGQIITKLKQMAEPFGLVVATIPPAYTSQFSARDGCAGVRVEEMTKQFEKSYPYSHLIKQETKKGERTELARHIQSVVDEFARLPNDIPSKKKRTLFVAVDGGPLFLPINRNKPDQADINAAINVALRGVAHPLRFDIYPVICCEDKKDDAVQIAKREWRLAKADKRFDAPVLADLNHKQEDVADISSLESDADADEPDSYSNVCSIEPSGLNKSSFTEKSFYQLPSGQFAVSRWDLFQHVHWRARNTIETINKQRVDAWKQGKHP